MKMTSAVVAYVLAACAGLSIVAAERPLGERFERMEMSDRRFTGPLFWLHGVESPELLEKMVDIVADSGQGMLTAESRHHNDWMGPQWWKDLDVVFARAKRNGLKVIIFDDPWWPSQAMQGCVPDKYGCRAIAADIYRKGAPLPDVAADEICRIACAETSENVFSLAAGDVTVVFRSVPANVRVNEGGKAFNMVDGLDPAAVAWFLDTVYGEHYRRYRSYFDDGTVIGFFFDEPETHGEWGPALLDELRRRGDENDLGKLLLAFKFDLADPEQTKVLRHRFLDARAEAWGRTMYGMTADWGRAHGVFTSGHFMEHAGDFYSQKLNAGDVMKMEKYTEVPGVDLVCRQYYPKDQQGAEKNEGMGQIPMVSASSAHVQNRRGGLNWCEIYGGYGQELTYPEMKWLSDWHQVRGCYVLIPHSFNPKAPNDTDYPPYFYNGGTEPRYPIFRVWSQYNNRSALLLSGGTHRCAIAQVLPGQSRNVAPAWRPEKLTFAIQDAQLGCDWFGQDDLAAARLATDPATGLPAIRSARGDEFYPVVILPAAELVDFAALEKALAFARAGGTVLGYGIRPKTTAARGRTVADVKRTVDAIFAQPTAKFLDGQPDSAALLAAIPAKAKLDATRLQDGKGPVSNLHAYRYSRPDAEVLFLANQNITGTRELVIDPAILPGEAEVWNPMEGTRAKAPVRDGRIRLTLAPSQALFLVVPAVRGGDLPVYAFAPTGTEIAVTDGAFALPALKPGSRVSVVCSSVGGEGAARVTVNGTFAGGFIGKPWQLDVTRFVKSGAHNTIAFEPFPVRGVKIVVQ